MKNNFARCVLNSIGNTEIYNPCYLYGNRESIKEMLDSFRKQVNEKNIYDLDIEHIQSATKNKENIDILILEDIELLEIKKELQKQFIELFNDLYDNKKKMIIASEKKVEHLNLDEKIKSRLTLGICVEID